MPHRSILSTAAVLLILSCSFGAGGAPVTRTATSRPAPTSANLETVLNETPALKKHIVWVSGDGKALAFDEWPADMKTRIDGFYRKYVANTRLDLHLPTEDNFASGLCYFTKDQAFDIYAAQVAFIVFVEARHRVPWSILNHPDVELDALFDSSHYFSRIVPGSRRKYPTFIEANRDFQETTVDGGMGELISDPRIGFDFLSGKTSASHENLIGKSELETLRNLTLWLRDNVDHGPIDDQQREREKTNRWLDARLRAYPGQKTAMAVQGCHSASKLMVDLARSVNVPLLHVQSILPTATEGGQANRDEYHGALVYNWGGAEPRLVVHTDVIYAVTSRISFPIGADGKLLPQAQADQVYFDSCWLTPNALAKMGFTYHLETRMPPASDPQRTNNRAEFGQIAGKWKLQGSSELGLLFEHVLVADARTGADLVSSFARNAKGGSYLGLIKKYRGPFSDEDLPALRPFQDQADRALAAIQALGGADKVAQAIEDRTKSRGQNLMPPAP